MLRRRPRRFTTTTISSSLSSSSSLPSSSSSLVLVHHSPTTPSIATVQLNQPQSLNAMTVQMGEEFEQTVHRLRTNESLRCVIVTGAGRAFSAGGDLEFIDKRQQCSHTQNTAEMKRFYDRFLSVRSLPVPTIAAINGPAVGAGLCLALACDIRIASATAKLGATFLNLGIHPGMGCSHLLPQLIGHERAYRLLLSGDLVAASTAYEWNLVSQVVDDVMSEAMRLAERIVQQPSLATQGLTRTLRMQQDVGLDSALWREASQQAACYHHDEHHRAIETLKQDILLKSKSKKKS